MSEVKLGKEEKEVLKEFETGKYKSKLSKNRKEFLRSVADETFKKDKRINIRISRRDLESIQRKALEEGIPYQTLISSILHKYISGSLKDTEASNQINKDKPLRG
ncbi:MAG: hypothetical protein R3F41_01515 [Gammaproteobacteria bacterium]|nr:hypothetical protein [Pseudomonadales bacterium]